MKSILKLLAFVLAVALTGCAIAPRAPIKVSEDHSSGLPVQATRLLITVDPSALSVASDGSYSARTSTNIRDYVQAVGEALQMAAGDRIETRLFVKSIGTSDREFNKTVIDYRPSQLIRVAPVNVTTVNGLLTRAIWQLTVSNVSQVPLPPTPEHPDGLRRLTYRQVYRVQLLGETCSESTIGIPDRAQACGQVMGQAFGDALRLAHVMTPGSVAGTRQPNQGYLPGQPTGPVPPPAGSLHSEAPPVTDAQIDRLIAIRRSSLGPLPGLDPQFARDRCVDTSLPLIDPKNPDWNATDLRWNPMHSIIADDCSAQTERLKQKLIPVVTKRLPSILAASYKAHLSSKDADRLNQFYATEIGRRYIAFQRKLIVVGLTGMASLLNKSGQASSQPSTEILADRARTLQLSTTLAMLDLDAQDARTQGNITAAGVAIMRLAIATSQGPELDTLRQTYSSDLQGFAAFANSPEEADELQALHDVSAATKKLVTPLLVEQIVRSRENLGRWRKIYRSMRTS